MFLTSTWIKNDIKNCTSHATRTLYTHKENSTIFNQYSNAHRNTSKKVVVFRLLCFFYSSPSPYYHRLRIHFNQTQLMHFIYSLTSILLLSRFGARFSLVGILIYTYVRIYALSLFFSDPDQTTIKRFIWKRHLNQTHDDQQKKNDNQ